MDDDQIVLAACNRILASEGHTVSLASSVAEALGLLKSQKFDLMLLDVIMPNCDGICLMGEVKELGLDLPMLVMSGYPIKENVERALDAGAAHFVAKPFAPAELFDAIGMVIGNMNANQEEANGNTEDSGD